MRNKDEILGQLELAYTTTRNLDERMIINSNLLLEVLVDVRDVLRWLFEEVRELNKKW